MMEPSKKVIKDRESLLAEASVGSGSLVRDGDRGPLQEATRRFSPDNRKCTPACMWLAGWLAGWLADRLAAWSPNDCDACPATVGVLVFTRLTRTSFFTLSSFRLEGIVICIQTMYIQLID